MQISITGTWNRFRNLTRLIVIKISLRKKFPYSELFWSPFFPHFPAFGLNTERSAWENAGKMWTRTTPNTDTFYAVFMIQMTLKMRQNHKGFLFEDFHSGSSVYDLSSLIQDTYCNWSKLEGQYWCINITGSCNSSENFNYVPV